MYITSDLFDAAPHYYASSTATLASPSLHDWCKMVDPQRTAGLGKRKRLPECDNATHAQAEQVSPHRKLETHMPGYGSNNKQPPPHPIKRPIPCHVHASNHSPTTTVSSEQRPMKQVKRTSPKKSTLTKSTSHLMDIVSEPTTAPDTTTKVASDVRPCHVCHKAPTRKRDLENYLECKSCDKRACYICARECAGGCQRPLCSTCCVEVGSDGDTWCLDCYHRNGNCI